MPTLDSPLQIVLRCDPTLSRKVRYVFDTLLMAAGIRVAYTDRAPADGPWLFYGEAGDFASASKMCLSIVHAPEAWRLFVDAADVDVAVNVDGVPVVLPHDRIECGGARQIAFDIAANAFYFLTSWSERVRRNGIQNRRLFSTSVYARLAVPQDVVDRYLARILEGLATIGVVSQKSAGRRAPWLDQGNYAVVLSHDIDFLADGAADIAMQGVKTILRHLVRQRDPLDAIKAAAGLVRAVARGRDPYSCVHEIIEREKELGVRSSFQVAVGHRHPNDVAYRIESDRTRDYLLAIPRQGFDLCLHGSYRSSENPAWYEEEVRLLERRLATPLGSRQHFLSFQYDNLFLSQERTRIEYDMSMGYPDQVGLRAGFSFPYFPYCIEQDRPYDVLQISLVLMDVTLRGYLGLKGGAAWEVMHAQLEQLRIKGGCASIVWHPIVFGGARDPGYEDLYWQLIQHVLETGGLATDGRTINARWREHACAYPSFSGR